MRSKTKVFPITPLGSFLEWSLPFLLVFLITRKMPCLYCNANFSIIKWKKKCEFCTHQFCTSCIVQKRCHACANVLNCQWIYESLMKVKIKDLKLYLSVRGTPVHLYIEKTELVRLVLLKQHSKSNLGSRIGISSQSAPPSRTRVEPHLSVPDDQSTSSQTSRPTNSQHETSELRTEERAGYWNGARNVSGQSSTIHDSTQDRPLDDAAIRSQLTRDSSDIDISENNGAQISSVERPTPTGLANKIVIADIKSRDQIELLTTRELKQILFDNFINYKGCVEKIELQTRVHNLYNDKEKAKQDSEKDATEESDICKICWDETIDCVLLDCGHMATCTSCGKRLNECPICRQFIVRCVHVFKS